MYVSTPEIQFILNYTTHYISTKPFPRSSLPISVHYTKSNEAMEHAYTRGIQTTIHRYLPTRYRYSRDLQLSFPLLSVPLHLFTLTQLDGFIELFFLGLGLALNSWLRALVCQRRAEQSRAKQRRRYLPYHAMPPTAVWKLAASEGEVYLQFAVRAKYSYTTLHYTYNLPCFSQTLQSPFGDLCDVHQSITACLLAYLLVFPPG